MDAEFERVKKHIKDALGINDDGSLKTFKTKTQECPKCGKGNAYYKEFHADTDMNEILLYCPDCKHTSK